MPNTSALSDAQSTCDGLQRLIQKIGEAAVDIDKGGSSSYEMLALVASANTCVANLGIQLTLLESIHPNVHPIKKQTSAEKSGIDPNQKLKIAK